MILENWGLIELDFASVYHIDLGDRALLRARSWRWLFRRAVGLLSEDSRLRRVLRPDDYKVQKQPHV